MKPVHILAKPTSFVTLCGADAARVRSVLRDKDFRATCAACKAVP